MRKGLILLGFAVAAFGAGPDHVVTFDSPLTPERVFFAIERVRAVAPAPA